MGESRGDQQRNPSSPFPRRRLHLNSSTYLSFVRLFSLLPIGAADIPTNNAPDAHRGGGTDGHVGAHSSPKITTNDPKEFAQTVETSGCGTLEFPAIETSTVARGGIVETRKIGFSALGPHLLVEIESELGSAEDELALVELQEDLRNCIVDPQTEGRHGTSPGVALDALGDKLIDKIESRGCSAVDGTGKTSERTSERTPEEPKTAESQNGNERASEGTKTSESQNGNEIFDFEESAGLEMQILFKEDGKSLMLEQPSHDLGMESEVSAANRSAVVLFDSCHNSKALITSAGVGIASMDMEVSCSLEKEGLGLVHSRVESLSNEHNNKLRTLLVSPEAEISASPDKAGSLQMEQLVQIPHSAQKGSRMTGEELDPVDGAEEEEMEEGEIMIDPEFGGSSFVANVAINMETEKMPEDESFDYDVEKERFPISQPSAVTLGGNLLAQHDNGERFQSRNIKSHFVATSGLDTFKEERGNDVLLHSSITKGSICATNKRESEVVESAIQGASRAGHRLDYGDLDLLSEERVNDGSSSVPSTKRDSTSCVLKDSRSKVSEPISAGSCADMCNNLSDPSEGGDKRTEDGKGKKKRVLTEERKAKKKIIKKCKRTEMNKKLGIKRLKIKPVSVPKKVVYCSFYLKGRCQQGSSCKFSHDTIPLTKSQPCCHFARGSCLKGDDCPFDHELKKYPCYNFKMKGSCFRGEECKFSHQIPDGGSPDATGNQDLSIPSDSFASSKNFKTDAPSLSVNHDLVVPMKVQSADNETKLSAKCPLEPPEGISFLTFADDLTRDHDVKPQKPLSSAKGHAIEISNRPQRIVGGANSLHPRVIDKGAGKNTASCCSTTQSMNSGTLKPQNKMFEEVARIFDEFLFHGNPL